MELLQKLVDTFVCEKEETRKGVPLDILTIFCALDDFSQQYEAEIREKLLASGERQRFKTMSLCVSEVMTIIVMFHASSYRNFKAYYREQVIKYQLKDFPQLVGSVIKVLIKFNI